MAYPNLQCLYWYIPNCSLYSGISQIAVFIQAYPKLQSLFRHIQNCSLYTGISQIAVFILAHPKLLFRHIPNCSLYSGIFQNFSLYTRISQIAVFILAYPKLQSSYGHILNCSIYTGISQICLATCILLLQLQQRRSNCRDIQIGIPLQRIFSGMSMRGRNRQFLFLIICP
jgi:hypothetical protein